MCTLILLIALFKSPKLQLTAALLPAAALLPPNASREDVQAWAMKNLYANGNGGAATSQPQQQQQQQAQHQHQQQQQQQQQASQQQHGHQQGQGRQQNGQQQHAQQQQQQQGGNGGGGGSKNSYQLAEAQLKQFHEAFANAERERKLRTAGKPSTLEFMIRWCIYCPICCSLAPRAWGTEASDAAHRQPAARTANLNSLVGGCDSRLPCGAFAGIMDGHGMPPNIIDPAGGGNSTRITLAHH